MSVLNRAISNDKRVEYFLTTNREEILPFPWRNKWGGLERIKAMNLSF
jgi:hypothetical protein